MTTRHFAGDTIAAIATAAGPAGVAIIRLSGPDALPVAARVTAGRVSPFSQPPQSLRRVRILDPETSEELDDGLRAVFRAPNSLTGEDVVELQCHGGTVVCKRVFAACLASGARSAKPGEFSERAFANGRMDLAQAEAVASLVAAGTVEAQRAARRQLGGALSKAVQSAAGEIKAALARIEAAIDFPEETGDLDAGMVDSSLCAARDRIAALLADAGYGRRLREGVTVVLAGRPNAGKSSLLNALSGTERAIVTPIPGTTRDIVEESLNFGGLPVRALDTAGLRNSSDPVEQIGIRRARQAVEDADAVIVVLDSTSGFADEDAALLLSLAGRPFVVAANKSDAADAGPVLNAARDLLGGSNTPILAISAESGSGLPELAGAVASVLGATATAGETALVSSARQEDALRRASVAIERSLSTLRDGMPPELIAVDSHGALQALGEITGETARDEIIAGIFATFCIGK